MPLRTPTSAWNLSVSLAVDNAPPCVVDAAGIVERMLPLGQLLSLQSILAQSLSLPRPPARYTGRAYPRAYRRAYCRAH